MSQSFAFAVVAIGLAFIGCTCMGVSEFLTRRGPDGVRPPAADWEYQFPDSGRLTPIGRRFFRIGVGLVVAAAGTLLLGFAL